MNLVGSRRLATENPMPAWLRKWEVHIGRLALWMRHVQRVEVDVIPRQWTGVSAGSRKQRVISMTDHVQRTFQSIGIAWLEWGWNRQWKHLETCHLKLDASVLDGLPPFDYFLRILWIHPSRRRNGRKDALFPNLCNVLPRGFRCCSPVPFRFWVSMSSGQRRALVSRVDVLFALASHDLRRSEER